MTIPFLTSQQSFSSGTLQMDGPRHCIRCRAELPKDSGYCVGCGFQNVDLAAKSATAEFARQEQIDKLKQRVAMQKMLRKWFWFLR